MATFRVEKPVSTLPGVLQPNTIYLLRVGVGFELHVSDLTGTVTYSINSTAGADGKTVLNGTGAPTGSTGTDGDFYIDTNVPEIYGPKSGGNWGSPTSLVGPQGAQGAPGPQGVAGADGRTILSGNGPPGGGQGNDGDFYIRTTTNEIYGPKSGGSWGSPTSLVGIIGAQDEGSTVLANPSLLDFVGAGVTVTDGGSGRAVITIPGGSGGDHNDLSNIQGGSATERYHLTAAQHADVVSLPTDLAGKSNTGHTHVAANITDFDAAVAATPAVAANTAKVSNATHTGDVTGATALTIADNAVSNAKAADMAQDRLKGRVSSGAGDPEDLTAAQVRTMLNVADGATANATDAQLRDRSTHTGSQEISTVTGLQTALDGKSAVGHSHGTADINNDAIDNTKLANMGQSTIKGRAAGAGTGDPSDLTDAQVRTILGVAKISVGTVAPSSPATGDLWVDTN